MHWDIFCRVVDNFGDIGVCWRLARQLATGHDRTVTLWVDAPDPLHKLEPEYRPASQTQTLQGVTVRRWRTPFAADFTIGDVVIEAFACELPHEVVDAMCRRAVSPVWINLEYLSAEVWVADCHKLPSPHPRLPLRKYFFFPGFHAGTGGLLREPDLFAQRDAFFASAAVRAQFMRRLGIQPPPDGALTVSLFAYEQPHLESLLARWSMGPRPLHLFVPEGRVLPDVTRFFNVFHVTAPACLRKGALTVQVLPFVSQQDFDRLLWLCDVNFVRGEDSFVRAQWAAKPFVWQAYPQTQAAHLGKVDAFLDQYLVGVDHEPARALREFSQVWNRQHSCDALWHDLDVSLPDLGARSREWAAACARYPDLATSLVNFCRDIVK